VQAKRKYKTRKKRKEVAKHSKLKKEVKSDYYFVLSDGRKIKNVKELAEEMGKMEDAVFFHHVTDERNDFAQWIKDVFDETELAEQISHIKNKHELQKKIYEYILKELW
jgi:hypothetical protein